MAGIVVTVHRTSVHCIAQLYTSQCAKDLCSLGSYNGKCRRALGNFGGTWGTAICGVYTKVYTVHTVWSVNIAHTAHIVHIGHCTLCSAVH